MQFVLVINELEPTGEHQAVVFGPHVTTQGGLRGSPENSPMDALRSLADEWEKIHGSQQAILSVDQDDE